MILFSGFPHGRIPFGPARSFKGSGRQSSPLFIGRNGIYDQKRSHPGRLYGGGACFACPVYQHPGPRKAIPIPFRVLSGALFGAGVSLWDIPELFRELGF